jgi:hypothetical protein
LNSNSSTYELTQIIVQTLNEREPKSLAQLIDFVKQKIPASEEKILKAILNLESQGKIRLDKPALSVSGDLSTYIKTPQATWYWVTMGIAMVTMIAILLVPEDIYPLSYLRIALGIIFIFWLPGYTCTKALFPVMVPIQSTSKSMDSIERLALGLGISIALAPIMGLILNYTPFGIRLASITISLLILTVVFANVGIFQEFNAKTTIKKVNIEITSQT